MEREPSESDVIATFRSEAGTWRPRRVPDLVELTRPAADSWRRPVALASAVGATALAIVLVLSLAVVTLVPANIGWADVVRDHLTHMP